jgi:TPR repeat protein
MNMRVNVPRDGRWPPQQAASRHRKLPAFLTDHPPQPQEHGPSRGSFVRLTTVVLTAAVITGALTIDWTGLVRALTATKAGVTANMAPSPREALITERPIAVKTIAITPAQPQAETANVVDVAAARAQLARELAQPDSDINAPDSANFGSAPSDQASKATARSFDPAETQRLLRRAEELLTTGDIAAARLILKRMAEANEGRAALLLAGSYDPLVLEKLNVYAFTADISKARNWYEKAREMGAPEASRRLELLAQAGR